MFPGEMMGCILPSEMLDSEGVCREGPETPGSVGGMAFSLDKNINGNYILFMYAKEKETKNLRCKSQERFISWRRQEKEFQNACPGRTGEAGYPDSQEKSEDYEEISVFFPTWRCSIYFKNNFLHLRRAYPILFIKSLFSGN
jgi:hypothetical protein